MPKLIAAITTITPTAVADTTNIASATYPFALQGAAGTQKNVISEIYMGGQAGASSPMIMLLSRDSTIGVTLSKGTGETEALIDFSAAASSTAAVTFNTATTNPQRSSTLHLANLSFNGFGGIVRVVQAPGTEFVVVGNTASGGEASLSAFTGGTMGALGAHMIYETF